jgi:hypothetical protein
MDNHYLYTCIGQLHQKDPDAIAIKFDTEYRDEERLPESVVRDYQIDPNRYILYRGAKSEERLNALSAVIKEGAKVRLIGVDSNPPIVGEIKIREFLQTLSNNKLN